VIETKRAETTEFFTAARASRSTVKRHRHYVAMAGLTLLDGRRNRMHAAMRIGEFKRKPAQVRVIV
jgi:hypothetical protein